MTVAFRSEARAAGNVTNGGIVTVTKPAGAVEDDLLVARVVFFGSGSPTVAPPAGFTQIGATSTAPGWTVELWKKQAGAAEPASYDFTATVGGGFSANVAVSIAAFDGNGDLDVDQMAQDGALAAADPVAPTITPTKSPSLLATLALTGGVTSFTAPGGQTERVDFTQATPSHTGYWGDEARTDLTATGTRTVDAASPLDRWWAANLNIYEVNVAPNAPTLTTPIGAAVIDRTATQRFDWDFSDPDAGDSQSAYDFRYRIGAGAWTTVSGTSPNTYHDLAGGTLAAGDYEWQARTTDALGLVGPYSASGFFTAATPPATPSITDPVNGSTISLSTGSVTWSTPSQTSYQVRKVADSAGSPDTATVYYDSGEVVSVVARSQALTYPTNSRWEHIQVRIKSSGLWSAWASVRVQVSYTPPATPVATATANAPSTGAIGVTTNVGAWPVNISTVTYTGTGNGTMTGPTATAGVTDSHSWEAILTTTAVNGGTFTVKKNGVTVGTVAVGVQFTHEGLSFTINDGATDFALNDKFTWTTSAVKTSSVDVRRREGATGDGIRVAAGIAPSATFTDWAVASSVSYSYRVKAIGSNGTSTFSAWSA